MNEAYRAAVEALSVDEDAPRRRAALEGLELPGRKDERWKFTNARKLLGEAAPVTGTLAELPAGMDARPHVAGIAGVDGLLALNLALHAEGATLDATQDWSGTVVVRTPDGLGTPRLFVNAREGVSVQLLIEHDLVGTSVPVIEVHAQPGSTVSLTQLVHGTGNLAGHVAVRAERDATVRVATFLTGGGITRAELSAEVGQGALLEASGLVLARDRQHADHHLELHHAGQGCRSTQLFRNLVDDRARAVFTGEVTVGRGITGTDAQQTANSLLLSDHASAVARPWLEIHNEEVTASHGATVGRLDPESLFYLRTRGLDAAGARRLLMRAFAGEVVATVPDGFRERIQDVVNGWLEA